MREEKEEEDEEDEEEKLAAPRARKPTQAPHAPSVQTREEANKTNPKTTITIQNSNSNSNSSSDAPRNQPLRPDPGSKHKPKEDWPDKFTKIIMKTGIKWKKFSDGQWREWHENTPWDELQEATAQMNRWLDGEQADNAEEDQKL